MRVAYVTTDEVNERLAMQMAANCGTTLDAFSPKDPPPDGEYAAVLYDLDYLPPAPGRNVLGELLAQPPGRPVAVHSYRLGQRQAAALRRHGCAVYPRLEMSVFRQLRTAVERAAVPAR